MHIINMKKHNLFTCVIYHILCKTKVYVTFDTLGK